MPASKASTLSSLFSQAVKTQSKPISKPKLKSKPKSKVIAIAKDSSTSSSSSSSAAAAEDDSLKHFVCTLGPAAEEQATSAISKLVAHYKASANSKYTPSSSSSSSSSVDKLREESAASFLRIDSNSVASLDSEEAPIFGATGWLTKRISSILITDALESSLDHEGLDAEAFRERELTIPWFPSLAHGNISLHRKEVTRERKQKWFFKTSQVPRFNRLVRMCTDKVGSGAAFSIFGKLGRETGVKEYNALIKVCIEEARSTDDEDIALQQIHGAYAFFKSMKENGLQVEDETYGPFLSYLIEMAMVNEFFFFCEVITEANPNAVSRLGYYEMLLWITVDDEEKVQELFNYILSKEGKINSSLQENYLLALCDGGREKELLLLFETIDITKFNSMNCMAAIFKSLGKLQLESFVEKFLLAFKSCDSGAENFSNFLCSYAIGNPNLLVDDVVLTFKNLHTKFEVTPSSAAYENLIKHCCSLHKVHEALDLLDEMFERGLTVSTEAINHILRACEESCNYNLAYRVYSLIGDDKFVPNAETFRLMISLCMRMKDVATSYNILNDVEKMNLTPTANMYNTIMAGYFREKNIRGALSVLKHMEKANVKPDSKTFSHLISNCRSEEEIDKYCEELKLSGVQTTKTVFMALINAYASCGQFEKAKQVVSDKWIPAKNMNEVKSVLVQALTTYGQFSDAVNIYEEIKQSGFRLEPKAVISLIEHYQSDGETSKLLKLLEELDDPQYWLDGCFRVVLFCVRQKHLSTAVDMLKDLKDKLSVEDEFVIEALLDEVFCLIGESEPDHLQIGLNLLQVIKDDLGLTPPRKCLDFLLHACVTANDLDSARLVWKEYEAAGLPHNILSFLRMYQALLVVGDHKAASILHTKIPKDDKHVREIIKACQTTYTESVSLEIKKKKKNTEKRWKSLKLD